MWISFRLKYNFQRDIAISIHLLTKTIISNYRFLSIIYQSIRWLELCWMISGLSISLELAFPSRFQSIASWLISEKHKFPIQWVAHPINAHWRKPLGLEMMELWCSFSKLFVIYLETFLSLDTSRSFCTVLRRAMYSPRKWFSLS